MKRELSIAFQTDKSAQEYIALAKLVNQYDFDVVSVYCDAPFHPSYPPLTLMAPHIHKARIGTAAVSPFRIHPIDIASQSALLADLAQGGTYIGLARGAWLSDFSIAEPSKPIQAIREAIMVIRQLLSGETGGYSGEFYSLAEHVRATYPLPPEQPPLLIGTWGKKLCAVAGELADEVKIGGSANPDVVSVIQDYIAVGETQAQREVGSVGVVVGAVCVVDEDGEQAKALARRAVALYMPVVTQLDPTMEIAPDLSQRIQEAVHQQNESQIDALISDDLLAKFAFAGTLSDIIDHCERLFDAGTSRIEFGTPHGISSDKGIRLLGEQVLPALT